MEESSLYVVIMTVFVPGVGEVTWTSEPMDDAFAVVVLWELSNGPFSIERAHKEPAEGAAGH